MSAKRRWHIFTPSGVIVPGMGAATKDVLWRRYAEVMGKTRMELEATGYVASQFNPAGSVRVCSYSDTQYPRLHPSAVAGDGLGTRGGRKA